jgi:hypothetical protein
MPRRREKKQRDGKKRDDRNRTSGKCKDKNEMKTKGTDLQSP